jgi:hypothetical protein
MKAKVYIKDSSLEPNGYDSHIVQARLDNSHAFAGLHADIIEIQEVKLRGAKDIDKLIRILECAKPCFPK